MIVRIAALSCVTALGATTALAETPFCSALSTFAAASSDLTLDNPMFTLSGREVSCTRSLGLGGATAVHCGWAFDYRAAAASEVFEKTVADVAECASPMPIDQTTVSHPDSYDLRQFQMDESVLSVSLKDKSALAETYVFMRVEHPAR